MCSSNFSCVFCVAPQFSLVTATPLTTTINTQDGTLSFLATLSSGSYYSDGSVITFYVPSPGAFTPSTTASLCTSVSFNSDNF